LLFVLLSLGPTLTTLTLLWRSPDHHNLTQSEKNSLYIWPPGMISDFALGAVAAEIAASHKLSTMRRPGLLADACVLAVFCAVIFAPNPAYEYRGGFEPLFDHALAPFFAIFLATAATDCLETTARGESSPPCSFAARLFSHPALCKIGESSFEVYLFQWPLHTLFVGIGLHTDQNAGQNFITFVLCLYFIAGLYEATLERPFVKWLRARTEPWLEQQQATTGNPLLLSPTFALRG
jgi:peptidoglycan/LPS O-acetylase OafA/YrhL